MSFTCRTCNCRGNRVLGHISTVHSNSCAAERQRVPAPHRPWGSAAALSQTPAAVGSACPPPPPCALPLQTVAAAAREPSLPPGRACGQAPGRHAAQHGMIMESLQHLQEARYVFVAGISCAAGMQMVILGGSTAICPRMSTCMQ